MEAHPAVATSDRDETLRAAWDRPPGPRGWVLAVNHKTVGMRFIVTGLAFLVAGGVLALLMRTQLAGAESGFLDAESYNEAFTIHGTTMMFLFAVPILEGLGMYLLPLMLGTRDLPFPRLNAFGYWAYLFGGLMVFASFLTGEAPDAGWFAYTPLSGPVYSPDLGMDFWLLGISLVEIAGILGGIELMVVFLARRAPGMSLARIPIFAWAVFVMAAMIVVAFPTLLTASLMLELERALGLNFFNPAAGGDPLLWQHLFWFFGHPEVYIMLIPAVGIISTVVPVFSRRSLAGYPYVVAALVAIGLLSFGLWVHHMFTTGISLVGLSFFAAASFLIAIPSGVQVFAWLATMWQGRPQFRPPLLFTLGFLVIFVVGGITGVMVAAVPFDWQVHDSYFVVAHFHYVLIGGVLFPVFGGLYYWFPKWTGRLMSEGLGQTSFWTMFAGFNLAFFPQHLLGFEGMPRRVYTYRAEEGWDAMNLLSTIGAYILALGIAITLINMALSLRRGASAGADPWGAGGLEWAASSPPAPYNFRHLNVVDNRDPLWREPVHPDGPLAAAVRELGAPAEPVREVLETSPVEGRAIGIARLPGPSAWPMLVVLPLTAGLVGALLSEPIIAAVGFALALAAATGWAADEPAEVSGAGPAGPLKRWHAGGGWWGAVIGAIVLLTIFGALAFSYVYLAADAEAWPPEGTDPPPLIWPLAGAAAGAAAVLLAGAARRGDLDRAVTPLAGAALASLGIAAAAALVIATADANPTDSAYGSILVSLMGFELALALAGAAGAIVTAWRVRSGLVAAERRVAIRVISVLLACTAASWVAAAALAYIAPRL